MKTIECRDISKSFQQGQSSVEVLSGVDFYASAQELILLIGPSGSGKTTLLSILGGISQPTHGRCSILNQDLSQMTDDQLSSFRGEHIGFLFQNFTLVPMLTARENVAIPLLISGIDHEKALKTAEDFLVQFGLDTQRFRTPHELSGGEQQRVALARACITNPRIILCDEPTSFLDRVRGEQIMQLLTSLKNSYKATIIVVTHDARIFPYADRILELVDGKVIDATDRLLKK